MSKESQEGYSIEVDLPPKITEDFERAAERRKLGTEQRRRLLEELKREYIVNRFEPGEAIGIIAAQSISEPSTQMSLPGNEKILVKTGQSIEPVEIGGFVDRLVEKFGCEKEGPSETADLPETAEYLVYSLDQDEKLRAKRIKSVIRHRSGRKLIEIRTASGRRIVATDNHSFVVRHDNRIVPLSGRELKVGDRLPVMRFLPENCIGEVRIRSIVPEEKISLVGSTVYPRNYATNKNSRGLPDTMPLDFSFGWLVGAYLSEGNATKYYTNISNTEECFNQNVRSFAQSFGLATNEYDNHRGFSKGHDIRINSMLLSEILKTTCGARSMNKAVPPFAYSAEKGFVKGLLQAYFDGDGSVTVERKGIRVLSMSKGLIDGIALLLARFGIFSSKSNDGHWLWVSCKYAEAFLEHIGTSSEERRSMLQKLVEKHKKRGMMREYTDAVPGIGDLLLKMARRLKFPTRYVNNFTKRQVIGRETLKKYTGMFEKIAAEKGMDISDELVVLKRALDSDVVWDRIEEVSYIDPSGEYVYDISVDGLETFTTFDGIITHNTMRAYHFAGSAGVRVTQGLPRLIEIFDAKRSPETPFTTIFLKKEFGNKDDAAKLAGDIVEKRVRDMIKNISINLTENYLELELLDKRKVEKTMRRLKETLKGFEAREKSGNIVIRQKEKAGEDLDVKKIREKVLDTSIEGIKNITSAIVRREGEEWTINTVGSNFEEILKLDEVDAARTVTNNIFEVERVLGIEAARNAIINESTSTLQEQGLDVDIRHVNLVSDIMTFSGHIEAIGRYGVAGTKTSILARAAFEETIKHLVRASVRNERDELKGIFENVMIGQVIPSGTGMFELLARKKEKAKKEEEAKKEEGG